MRKDLRPLLAPRTIAIVGASERSGAGSHAIENLRQLGFDGRIVPVNPKYREVHGLPSYPSLDSIPASERIDCVAVLLGNEMIMPVLAQAAARGIPAAWAFASGFAEVGEDGSRMQHLLQRFCQEHGIAFCGPNCVGFVNLNARTCACSAPLSHRLKPGRIAAIAQSGAAILAIANANRGVGFSHLISSGNEAVLDAVDYLEYLVNDPSTDVIMAFLEAIRRPREFERVCRRAAEVNKPLVLVKVGRTELARRTAVTHTGALAGSDAVQSAFFRRAGVERVDSIDELLETAEMFAHLKGCCPRGNRVGLITVSGGEMGLIADQMDGLPLQFGNLSADSRAQLRSLLPAYSPVGNPLDAWGSGDLKRAYPGCIQTLAQDPGVDLVLVSQDVPTGMAPKQVEQFTDVARAAVAARGLSSKPVIVFSNVSGGVDPVIQAILSEGGVPCLQGTRSALRAATALVRRSEFHDRVRSATDEAPPTGEVDALGSRLRATSGVLSYAVARQALETFGIELPFERLVQCREDALAAMQAIGAPVALKVSSPAIPHKTESGLLQLAITAAAEMDAAWTRLERTLQAHHPGVPIDGFLVQRMAPAGCVEMLVGLNRDEAFGPAVVVGLGGIWVEALGDSAMEMAPLTHSDARRMVDSLRGAVLLGGARGRPAADVDALVDLLVRVGRLAAHLDHISGLDLNPVMVLPRGEGVQIVDVVLTAHPTAP